MFSFAIDCDSEEALEATMKKLRQQHNVTGELSARPLPDGRWRLVVHSEKNIRESTIEKLQGTPVELAEPS